MGLTEEEKAFIEEKARQFKESDRKTPLFSHLTGMIVHEFSLSENKIAKAWNLFKALCDEDHTHSCPHSESIRSQLTGRH